MRTARRPNWFLIGMIGGSLAFLLLAVGWPTLERQFAAWMIARAVQAEENDLEASQLLSTAIERVQRFDAREEAEGRLVPLLDPRDGRRSLRARYCLLQLPAQSPASFAALAAIFADPQAPAHVRMDVAGLLTILSPERAAECGAAEAWRVYAARRRSLDEDDGADLLPGTATGTSDE